VPTAIKNGVSIGNRIRIRKAGNERKAPSLEIGFDQCLELRPENWDFTFLEFRDFFLVNVYARNINLKLGKQIPETRPT